MNPPTTIQTVKPDEAARVASILVMAFSADPTMRWIWPEPHAFIHAFPGLVRGFGDRAFDRGTAHVTADFSGAAVWLAPGVGVDEQALELFLERSVPEPRRSQVASILEQFEECHPREPHWHLAFLGVDPRHQRKGIGAALLRHALAAIDARGEHAYLESSNPANLDLYRRHGFEVIREVRAGDAPPSTTMLRVPRGLRAST